MSDWRDFLEEVHAKNKESMELSKQREHEIYGNPDEREVCESK